MKVYDLLINDINAELFARFEDAKQRADEIIRKENFNGIQVETVEVKERYLYIDPEMGRYVDAEEDIEFYEYDNLKREVKELKTKQKKLIAQIEYLM